MSEHIIDVTDGFIESYGQFSKGEIVRCGDCKYGINDGELCAEGASDSWDWRNVEPDGFCAWGEKRGE